MSDSNYYVKFNVTPFNSYEGVLRIRISRETPVANPDEEIKFPEWWPNEVNGLNVLVDKLNGMETGMTTSSCKKEERLDEESHAM